MELLNIRMLQETPESRLVFEFGNSEQDNGYNNCVTSGDYSIITKLEKRCANI